MPEMPSRMIIHAFLLDDFIIYRGKSLETAEVSLKCAYALFQMEKYGEAVRLLRQAITKYSNENIHNMAISSWMLGDALWRMAKQKNNLEFQSEAFDAWERCHDIFVSLSAKNKEPTWYADKSARMRAAIEFRTNKVF